MKNKHTEQRTELGNDMREWKEYFRQKKQERRESETLQIKELEAVGIQVRQISEYQFRFWGHLDIYPTNKRWHDIKTSKRGGYSELYSLLEKRAPK